jgi:hypothetical protein
MAVKSLFVELLVCIIQFNQTKFINYGILSKT